MKNTPQGGSQPQGTQSQNSGQQGSQSQRSQQELDTIIRGGSFNSQSDANTYLQKHGLSCQLKEDGSADIFDTEQKRVASVMFNGQTTANPRQISGINY